MKLSHLLVLCLAAGAWPGYAQYGALSKNAAASEAKAPVAHGVTKQFEKGDSFPFYDEQVVNVGSAEPYYDPMELTVHPGDVVRWVNKKISDTHTVLNGDGQFGSPDIRAGTEWCQHFTREGNYRYTCRFHPWMKGVVHVTRRALPVARDAAGENLHKLARFKLANRQAVEGDNGEFWLPGLHPGTLARRALSSNAAESVRVEGTAEKLVPLAFANGRLMISIGRQVAAVDLSSKRLSDRIDLPEPMAARYGAGISDGHLWGVTADRTSLIAVNLKDRSARVRKLAPGSRIAAINSVAPDQAWAIDASRKKLIKLSSGWLTEYALPADVENPDGVALDSEGRVWFADSNAGVIGVLHANGMAEEFSLGGLTKPELVQLPKQMVAAASGGQVSVLQLPLNTATKNMAAACLVESNPGNPAERPSTQNEKREESHDHGNR